MALFKAVKKPLIRQTPQAETPGSSRRPRYVPKPPPCAVDCPIGCDIRGMLTTIAEAEADGRTVEEALELAWRRITARNPFPSVCGRICAHSCEANCHRQIKEGAVAVHVVERFAGDFAIGRGLKFTRTKELAETVAVVGAGPAGLSAAYHLARWGYRVRVFEEAAQAGGMMRSWVAGEILDAEIGRILALGVDLICGCGADAVESSGAAYAAVVNAAPLETGDPSAVASAVAAGLHAAAAVWGGGGDAPSKAPVPRERIRPEWYKDQPRIDASGEVTAGGVVLEARRCLTCGMCMGCGNCWSYCTKGGFEKVASARRYKLRLERCNGCAKCADGCPSGYIDMV